MNKLLALVFLTITTGCIGAANWWFTFGMWPKSWWSFSVCLVLSMINANVLAAVLKSE